MKRFRTPLLVASVLATTAAASISIVNTPTSGGFPKDPRGGNVIPGGTAPRGQPRETDTSRQIRAKIKNDDRLSADSKSINVVVQGNTVRLQGTVTSALERNYVRRHVREVMGSKIRIDESKLKVDTELQAR